MTQLQKRRPNKTAEVRAITEVIKMDVIFDCDIFFLTFLGGFT